MATRSRKAAPAKGHEAAPEAPEAVVDPLHAERLEVHRKALEVQSEMMDRVVAAVDSGDEVAVRAIQTAMYAANVALAPEA